MNDTLWLLILKKFHLWFFLWFCYSSRMIYRHFNCSGFFLFIIRKRSVAEGEKEEERQIQRERENATGFCISIIYWDWTLKAFQFAIFLKCVSFFYWFVWKRISMSKLADDQSWSQPCHIWPKWFITNDVCTQFFTRSTFQFETRRSNNKKHIIRIWPIFKHLMFQLWPFDSWLEIVE